MPQSSHDNLGVVDEFFQLALFFLRNVSGGRVVPILNEITLRFVRQSTEAVFKVADFRRPEDFISF
ncbi:MAG: hypothetical protein APF81_05190 [Desulfosporosinus sp. BRH_c37]|nr:MAG: hypothetical protein APF81_05190 [Desulfosporosinus sp. BRH_c37]